MGDGYQVSSDHIHGTSYRPHVVVVDDTRLNLELTDAVLSPRGFDVTLIQHPDQVLHTLQGKYVDLILMDVYMPTKGDEVSRRVCDYNPNIPIIMYSSDDHSTILKKVGEFPPNVKGYLQKEGNSRGLVEIVRQIILEHPVR